MTVETNLHGAHRNIISRKVKESADTAAVFFAENADKLQRLAIDMAVVFQSGGKLLTAGNGGSACDAQHVSVEFMHPVFEKRKPLPCFSLVSDTALLTAIANDIDFSATCSTQLACIARPGDMFLAISTSGMSSNLVRAIEEARRLKVKTIALSGKDGGRLSGVADWSFVVPSYSIHRIQEVHVMFLHILWDLIHINLGEEDIV